MQEYKKSSELKCLFTILFAQHLRAIQNCYNNWKTQLVLVFLLVFFLARQPRFFLVARLMGLTIGSVTGGIVLMKREVVVGLFGFFL